MSKEKQLVEEPAEQPLWPEGEAHYGNEGYVATRKPRAGEPGHQAMTQAEWLAQALEAQTVLLRGDHVSPELIEDLFLESIPVIQNPPNPPDAARKK